MISRGAAVLVAAFLAGCGGEAGTKATTTKTTEKTTSSGKTTTTETTKTQTASTAPKTDKGDHDHSGWWCAEHGVPEEECSMCSEKVAKEFKTNGDWCDKHDRALSQCFICKPERRQFYAAKYRAKYGKEPPATEDQEKTNEKKG
jgi:hypothetical protein